jgi:nucleotide-binding universal stress UspA family protein
MTSTAEQRAATNARDEGFSRILVASDGSADARLAVRAAIDLARRAGAILDVVSAWAVRTWPYGIYGADGSGLAEMLEGAEADGGAHVEAVAADAEVAARGWASSV